MKRTNKLLHLITALFIAVTFLFFSFSGGARIARAAVTPSAAFEHTNVMDDLKDAVINGEPFCINDYNFDESKPTQVLSFIEFCYSFYENMQDDFGLYIYVYNPQGLEFVYNSTLNSIEMACTSDPDDKIATYSEYSLEYLNMSTTDGYEGMFFKYKVMLNETQKADILSSVGHNSRIYKISGIDLLLNGESKAHAYEVGQNYTYSGYSKGYGSVYAEKSTLSCTVYGIGEILRLDVKPTYYRLDATNGKANTQDTLNSVYFAVPKEYIQTYGGMSAVYATWLNAYTAPIFVIGDESIYNSLLPYVGVDIGDYNSNIGYMFASALTTTNNFNHFGRLGYNFKFINGGMTTYSVSENLTKLDWLFSTNGTQADHFVLSSEKILSYMKEYTKDGELVLDQYSAALFESVDSEYSGGWIQADDKRTLNSAIYTVEWYQRLFPFYFGSETLSELIPTTMQAIYEVTDDDFKELSEKEICERLYIAESDYTEFKNYYDKFSADNVIYLFRYCQTEYLSEEITYGTYKKEFGLESFVNQGTNAYLCQQWIQLDFDIIDVKFTKDDVETIIPVAMSPMDITSDSTPPLITTHDPSNWWIYALISASVLIAAGGVYTVIEKQFKKES